LHPQHVQLRLCQACRKLCRLYLALSRLVIHAETAPQPLCTIRQQTELCVLTEVVSQRFPERQFMSMAQPSPLRICSLRICSSHCY
jgi:hypothetical protein